MTGPLSPLKVQLFPPERMVALWADAYAEAARAGMPMRQAAEALELLRERVLAGDPLEALREADDQLGAAFGRPLQQTVVKLRAAMEEALVSAVEFPDEHRRREVFALFLGRWRARLLPRVLDGWSATGRPGDAALAELLRHALLEAWPLAHDPMCELAATIPEGPLWARLQLMIGQIQLFHFGHFGTALKIFERARSCSPDDLEIVGSIGRWWELWGDMKRARELFSEEISRAPDRPSGYIRIGRSFTASGELESAEAQLTQALALAPGDTEAMHALIELYSRRELYQARRDSITDLERKILLIAPDEEAGLVIADGALHRRADRLELASVAYEKATRRFPGRADAWIGLGACATDRANLMDDQQLDHPAQLQAAKSCFTRALEVEPRNYRAYEGQSVVAELGGDLATALAHMRDGARCHPGWSLSGLVREAQLHRGAKDLAEAERALKEALMLDPGNREALRELARVGDNYLYEGADHGEAIRIYEMVREGWGEVAPDIALNLLGNLYFYESDFARAVDHYRQAARANPTDSVLHGNLADALLQLPAREDRGDQLAEAMAALRQATALDPSSSRFAELLRKVQAERDLLVRYGPAALKWLPAYPAISVSVAATLLSQLLDKSGVKLNEDAVAASGALRKTIWRRIGLELPSMTFRELSGDSVPPNAWQVTADGEKAMSSGVCSSTGEAARGELFSTLEAALLAGIPAWLSLDVVSASLDRANLADLSTQPGRLVTLRDALCEAARTGPPRPDLLAELAGSEAVQSAQAIRAPTGTDELPELAQAPDVRVGHGFSAAKGEAAVEEARLSLFEETGVVLPLIKVSTDDALPRYDWHVVASDARKIERTGASDLDGSKLADILRDVVPSMLSRQLLSHYLGELAAQRPVLTAAAQTVLGDVGIGTALAERLRRGRSIRALPIVLEELVSRSLLGATSGSAVA